MLMLMTEACALLHKQGLSRAWPAQGKEDGPRVRIHNPAGGERVRVTTQKGESVYALGYNGERGTTQTRKGGCYATWACWPVDVMYNLTVTHLGTHGQRKREIRGKEIRKLCNDRLKLDLDTNTP